MRVVISSGLASRGMKAGRESEGLGSVVEDILTVAGVSCDVVVVLRCVGDC